MSFYYLHQADKLQISFCAYVYTCVYFVWNALRTYLLVSFPTFRLTEAAVLTGTVPFPSLLLACALLNPLLLFKLTACNELNSF